MIQSRNSKQKTRLGCGLAGLYWTSEELYQNKLLYLISVNTVWNKVQRQHWKEKVWWSHQPSNWRGQKRMQQIFCKFVFWRIKTKHFVRCYWFDFSVERRKV